MSEHQFDRMLQIRTNGIREWKDRSVPYNRYEPTPYRALEHLFRTYKLKPDDQVVDFGCGRGRVSFYIHHRFHVAVTGIEVNELTYEEALDNKSRYRQIAKHIEAPIRIKYGLAEHYEVKKTDTCFYFFNPFSVKIFKKVVRNILRSFAEHRREIDLILYYPMPEYKHFLRTKTPFTIVDKVKVPQATDQREKFIIYRLHEHAELSERGGRLKLIETNA